MGVNALKVENSEEAHTTTLKDGDNNYTIYFNFCYNLKSSSTCNYNKKQVYIKDDSGTCKPLSGDIKSGNQSNSTTEEIEIGGKPENRSVLHIKVNEEPNSNSTFEYRLVCKENGDKKKFSVMKDLSIVDKNSDGGYNVILYIESYEACEKINFYFIWKFIEDYRPIFIIALMAFGLLNCINTRTILLNFILNNICNIFLNLSFILTGIRMFF